MVTVVLAAATLVFSFISFIILAMASGLISANVRKLADKHGWDTFLVHWAEKLRWVRLRGLWWVWWIFGFSGGIAVVLWIIQLTAPSPPEIRMGPRTAIGIGLQLAGYAFEKAKQPGQQFAFAVIITAPPENAVIERFINELFTIPHLAQRVRILPSPGENDVSPLKQLTAQKSAGIIIHGDNEPFVSGIAITLGKCFIISTDNTLPPELEEFYKYISPTPQFIWVRIGHGSTWKPGAPCQS
jgi:hypothetical protein